MEKKNPFVNKIKRPQKRKHICKIYDKRLISFPKTSYKNFKKRTANRSIQIEK